MVGMKFRILYSVKIIADAVEGPNFVSKYLFKSKWTAFVKPIEDPGLRAATKTTVRIDEMVLLHVQIVSINNSAWLWNVRNPEFPLLLSTYFCRLLYQRNILQRKENSVKRF